MLKKTIKHCDKCGKFIPNIKKKYLELTNTGCFVVIALGVVYLVIKTFI